MTVTLHLKPEVEVGLLAYAQASGLTVEAFLLRVVEGAVIPGADKAPSDEARGGRAEAVRRMLAFGETHRLSLGEPVTRALLHEGHRF